MKYTRNQWIIAVIVAVLAAGCVTAGCQGEQKNKVALPSASADAPAKKEADKPAAKPAEKSGARVEEGASTSVTQADSGARRFNGSFEPQRTSGIAASVPGVVREVFVVEGQRVSKGDRLINVDAQNYNLQVAQAQAAIKAAEAQVDTLQVEFERATTLRKQEAIAASQVDQLTGQLAAARAMLQQAKVGLQMAQKARNDAMIRAPYDGVITQVSVAEGDYAAPGPMPLVQLAEVQKLYLRIHVPEQYSQLVQPGDVLEVRVAALNDTLRLPVARVNPMISAQSRAFDVLAEVDNADLRVRAGMFAEATLPRAAQGAPGAGASNQETHTDAGEK